MPKHRTRGYLYQRDLHGDLIDGRQVRRTRAPAGTCSWCWTQRRSERGRFYVWGFPSLTPGRGRTICYCDGCVERHRSIGIQLIPAGARGSD